MPLLVKLSTSNLPEASLTRGSNIYSKIIFSGFGPKKLNLRITILRVLFTFWEPCPLHRKLRFIVKPDGGVL